MAAPIVNVASVRHLSPFRYPGGKTWLVPRVTAALRGARPKPTLLVDPFLGGGSVPLAAIVEGHVEEAILCELDDDVAAVWQIVFSRDYRKLCAMISDFEIDRERVIEVLSHRPRNTLARAFQTIIRNRTFRGGILASGASLVKDGENGRGVASRWYPDTLVKRISLLQDFRDRITFIHGDGTDLLREQAANPGAFIFVDPPYTAGTGKRAGTRLYGHNDVDHEAIFATLERGRANFMMTYDDDIDVLNMARRNGFMLQYVQMKNTHHRCMNELLITRV